MRGLASFPKADQTPLALPVRLSFLGMIGIRTYLIALSLWYWLRRRGRTRPTDRWTLLALAASGPLAFLANELGWMVTELGRQPWVIYGVLRTQDAITTAPGLGAIFTGFTLLYVVLAGMTSQRDLPHNAILLAAAVVPGEDRNTRGHGDLVARSSVRSPSPSGGADIGSDSH